MSLWKQLALILGLIAVATGLSARFLPASHPVLQRIGLLAPLERLGVVAQPPRPMPPRPKAAVRARAGRGAVRQRSLPWTPRHR